MQNLKSLYNSLILNDEVFFEQFSEKILLFSYGCPDSIWDLETIAFNIDSSKLSTPIIFIDTCCAIDVQENISKEVVRQISLLYPNHEIFITGCGVNYDREFYSGFGRTFSNQEKFNVVNYDLPLKISSLDKANPHFNGFIKISDGCDYNCSYCIIKEVRPRHTFSYLEISKQIKDCLSVGQTQICLFGTEISNYSADGLTLLTLIKKLLMDFPDLTQIKLDSINPGYKDIFELIDLIKSEDKLAKEIDLSVQSFSNRILSLMHRPYSKQRLFAICDAAQGLSIQAQLIIGFPSETEDDFNETLQAISTLNIERITTCPFSLRKWTSIYPLDTVPLSIKHEREQVLINACTSKHGFLEAETLSFFNSFKPRVKSPFVCNLCDDSQFFQLCQTLSQGNQLVILADFNNTELLKFDIRIRLLFLVFEIPVIVRFIIDDFSISLDFEKFMTMKLAAFVTFDFQTLSVPVETVISFLTQNKKCNFDEEGVSKLIVSNPHYLKSLPNYLLEDL